MLKRTKTPTQPAPELWTPLKGSHAAEIEAEKLHLWRQLEVASAQPQTSDVDIWELVADRINPYKYRPCQYPEIECEPFETKRGERYYILHNPIRDTYARLTEEDEFVWQKFDGTNTLRDIAVAYTLKYKKFNFSRVTSLMATLKEKGMLREVHVDIFGNIIEAQAGGVSHRFRQLIDAFFSKDWSLNNIDGPLGRMYNMGFWVFFTRPGGLLLHLLGLIGFVLAGQLIAAGTYSLLDLGPNIILRIIGLMLFSNVVIFFHEAAHGMAVKHYGRRVRRGGAMIYFGRLAFFIDTTDIWMASRRARIIVSWAGPIVNFSIGGATLLCVTFLNLPHDWATYLYQAAFINMMVGVLNLHPLLELDGYYMLMDYLEIPNLRRRSFDFVRGPLVQKIKTRTALTRPEWGLAFFGMLAGSYTIFATIAGLIVWRNRISGMIADLVGETIARLITGTMFMSILISAFWPRIQALIARMQARKRVA